MHLLICARVNNTLRVISVIAMIQRNIEIDILVSHELVLVVPVQYRSVPDPTNSNLKHPFVSNNFISVRQLYMIMDSL